MKNLIGRFSISFALLGVLFLAMAALAPRAEAGENCCRITAINAKADLVTAKDSKSGQVFQFKVGNAKQLKTLKVGRAVNFTRRAGLSVQGLPAKCCKPIRPTKPIEKPQIDCSITPELCPGGKPQPPIDKKTGPEGDFIDQLNDFCADDPDSCVPGPM